MDDRLLFQDRVRERDLDNFLIEELYASEDFRAWLVGRLSHSFDEPAGCEIRLQKSPTRLQDKRQTDVQIGWFDQAGALRACILIESKVTAGFQPGQAQAYGAERAQHRSRTGTRSAASVLIAPEARFAALAHDGAFDAVLSIEEIIATLDARLRGALDAEITARLTARIDLLESLCGKKMIAAWTPVTIDAKRDFAAAYAVLAAEILPKLRVRPSTDGPKAITRIFEGLDLGPGFPASTLRHEFGAGVAMKYANVQLRGLSEQVGVVRHSGLLNGTPYEATDAGKALAIRVPTPGIDPTLPFERERDKVRLGLEAIRDLVAWLLSHREQLAALLHPAPPPLVAPPPPPSRPVEHPLERAFAQLLRDTYRECDKLGYRPTAMLDMVERGGGIETARRLLANPPSEGFARLALLRRLDLAIESLVLQPRWEGIFTEAELRTARRRLR